ncbi:trem-like transcript 4 protein isoform X2 [Sciurus carolinensis]|uniref:trem-like transcript 4 protein isoform X2 n=1 Tax=Sciurus carolinensis TaxID=30640 RepID=UPI001FB36694|nr:trem-like transcript 4 protein isoform X2 [Sciurus carolinensis]
MAQEATYLIPPILLVLLASASTPPTTRSTRMTTALASATSPDIGSPPGNWKWTFISSGLVVAVLLLGLIVLLVLYLRKAQGRDRKGEKESHDIYEDTADQKQKASGFHRQSISDEDTGAICYVSLIHLNHCGPEDSIYINTHPNPQLKPRPDPFQSVEYASIAGKRPAPSTLDALDGNLGTEAEFTRQ